MKVIFIAFLSISIFAYNQNAITKRFTKELDDKKDSDCFPSNKNLTQKNQTIIETKTSVSASSVNCTCLCNCSISLCECSCNCIDLIRDNQTIDQNKTCNCSRSDQTIRNETGLQDKNKSGEVCLDKSQSSDQNQTEGNPQKSNTTKFNKSKICNESTQNNSGTNQAAGQPLQGNTSVEGKAPSTNTTIIVNQPQTVIQTVYGNCSCDGNASQGNRTIIIEKFNVSVVNQTVPGGPSSITTTIINQTQTVIQTVIGNCSCENQSQQSNSSSESRLLLGIEDIYLGSIDIYDEIDEIL